MDMKLNSITIQGYKSISNLPQFKLRGLNVLIGINGAGKSNFLGFFNFFASLVNGNLVDFVSDRGGANALLYRGVKNTPQIKIELHFEKTTKNFTETVSYHANFVCTDDDKLRFANEKVESDTPSPLGRGHFETKLSKSKQTEQAILSFAEGLKTYHFCDTSISSPMRRLGQHIAQEIISLDSTSADIVFNTQYPSLNKNAANLASYIVWIRQKHPVVYQKIISDIRQIAPFFDDFIIEMGTDSTVPQQAILKWIEKSDQNYRYNQHLLSDGMLRFIGLMTLLNQPMELLPNLIMIDEPELGLHPVAISLVASKLQKVAQHKQVIVATQSVELIDELNPEDIIVVERNDQYRTSTFKRCDSIELKNWLEDYSLGTLWRKNVLGGRP